MVLLKSFHLTLTWVQKTVFYLSANVTAPSHPGRLLISCEPGCQQDTYSCLSTDDMLAKCYESNLGAQTCTANTMACTALI